MWGRILKKLAHFQTMEYLKFSFTTAKEHVVDTVGMGVLIVEHTNTRYQNKNENLSSRDGKLNTFILAPSKYFSYMYYLLMILFAEKCPFCVYLKKF